MDNVRRKVTEQNKNRQRKILLGLIAIIIVVVAAIMIERSINMNVTDVTISKSEITEEKAVFIPVRPLDTNVIAVKLTDGSYRLAFDDCTGCYTLYGKHGKFENNADNTGLICKNCKSEVLYEQMGFLPEESMPYPIEKPEIIETEDSFILNKDYLEKHKQILETKRSGKGINPYSENSVK